MLLVRRKLPALVRIPLAVLLAFSFADAALAEEPVIFIVRHAERAAISGRVPSDTGLSATGRERADALASELKDAQIAAIYTSEFQRTKETAAPLAKSLGIRPEVVSADDLRGLLAELKAARGNVLVVGHSNTIPQILNGLGVPGRITIAESDYDNLFVVVRDPKPRLIHLHYR